MDLDSHFSAVYNNFRLKKIIYQQFTTPKTQVLRRFVGRPDMKSCEPAPEPDGGTGPGCCAWPGTGALNGGGGIECGCTRSRCIWFRTG